MEIERLVDDDLESLNVDFFSLASPRQDLRVSVWADRILWLRSCQMNTGRSAGWHYSFAYSLDATDLPTEAIVKAYMDFRIHLDIEAAVDLHWSAFSPKKDTSVSVATGLGTPPKP